MRDRLRKLLGGTFLRRLMTLSVGTVGARAIAFLATPLLTRIYSPEDFGVLGLFVSLFAPLVVISSLRFEIAILLPKTDREAADVVHLAVLSVFGVSTAVALASWLLGPSLLPMLSGGTVLLDSLWLLTPAILAAGLYQVAYHWALRQDALAKISWTRVVQSGLMLATQFLWVLVQISPKGLILGHVLGHAGGTSTLIRTSLKDHRELLLDVSRKGVAAAARKYKRFALMTSPGNFLGNLCLQLPVLALAALFDEGIVGQFSMTILILGIAQTLVGQAVGQLFTRDLAKKLHEDPAWVRPAFYRVSRYLVLIGLVVCIAGLAAPFYLPVFFGPKWIQTGAFAQILAVPLGIQLLCGTTNNLMAMSLNSWQAIWDIFRLVVIGGTFIAAGVYELDVYQTLGVYAVARTGIYISLYALNVVAIRRHAAGITQPTDQNGVQKHP